MEVYATRYNLIYHLDKIINRQLNSKIDDYIIQNLLFNKSHNRYLTDFSIEQCYYLVEFLNGPKEFILKHGKAVIDNNEYYKFTHPAYHISDQCDRINSDFKNLVIPKRVRNNIGIVEIIRSAPNEILDVNQSTVLIEKLCKDINLKFNIEPKLKFEDFMKIEKDTGQI
ncbi:MAG: hypothetical protein IPL23_27575 [Saprospiraceae bacterium]|nr:hypothetical protein [Saprospiraceae bacterium]